MMKAEFFLKTPSLSLGSMYLGYEFVLDLVLGFGVLKLLPKLGIFPPTKNTFCLILILFFW